MNYRATDAEALATSSRLITDFPESSDLFTSNGLGQLIASFFLLFFDLYIGMEPVGAF